MSLLQKLKSALGFGDSGGRSPGPADSTGDVDVTVEREPSTSSEDAVKGTDTDRETATDTGDSSDEGDDTGASETSETPVDEIKGIGQAYSDRLGNAGIESVADLGGADPTRLAEETGIAEGRIETWIERANEF